MNFFPDSSKVFLLRNGWLFQLRQNVSKSFELIAMNDAELSRSSGYFTELCLKRKHQVIDEPDFAMISQCNIDRVVFDENNQTWPPLSPNFCCFDKLKSDHSLLVIHIHSFVIFIRLFFVYRFLRFLRQTTDLHQAY